ncbi:phage tail protein [Pseudomonas floridensis]|uniref:Phage tail protein n=1 Tax=Pseudomonas floridensis TaxID=1958950 RepID=A0A1X0N2L7_9PSED|nr:hypothetical protein [Pseudomonas floridensis]ORC57736.1 phage tail protein [Pseudomonas floridensis]
MDYPKSVPGVGLVSGKFIDENPATGTPGSLIPAQWGNSVTQEILNAMAAGGEQPDEGRADQLAKAIAQISRGTQPVAKVLSFNENIAFTKDQMELLLLDASGGSRAFTLPSSNSVLGTRDVIVRRVDNSGNRLVINAAAEDRIKFHTHLNAAGYTFLVLMGAGDWWHLRSDGVGNWWPVGRYDSTPLGRPFFETTTLFSPGGYGALNGALLNRADWPWLWDHAQKSGMLYTEAGRTGKEGGWTAGDGALTFRGPEGRGEFLRVLDESRGVDASRVAGSWQDGTWLRTVAQEWTGSDLESGTFVLGNAHAQADGRLASSGVGGVLPSGALIPAGGSAYPPATTDNAVTGTAVRNEQAMNNWIRFRSRNIAYPGRIKLI